MAEMAKNDYFVLVYQILKYLYDCLKNGKTPDVELMSDEALMIPHSYWIYIFVNLQNQGFISGVKEIKAVGGYGLDIRQVEITPEGISYLFDNNLPSKAVRALKGFKDVVPGL